MLLSHRDQTDQGFHFKRFFKTLVTAIIFSANEDLIVFNYLFAVSFDLFHVPYSSTNYEINNVDHLVCRGKYYRIIG